MTLQDNKCQGKKTHVSDFSCLICIYLCAVGPEIQCTTIELQEGETLEGKCSVAGNPPPVLTWHKDGQPIDPSMPLSRDTAGMYKLQAQGNSDIEKDIRVLVLCECVFYMLCMSHLFLIDHRSDRVSSLSDEPVLMCPSTYTAHEDTTHNLTCAVKGYPQPVVMWFKDGEEVDLPERLTRSDTGQYLITASNSLSSTNVTVDITVQCKSYTYTHVILFCTVTHRLNCRLQTLHRR